jgi:2-dehydro-3-deoxygluconokinase
MKKVFCFGEILLRMSPVLDQAWIHSASMPVHIGGAELNVAKALAGWKQPVTYMSAMPDNYLSKEIADSIAACNIGIEAMQFCGDRMGIYFLPQGADLKNAGVIYDRAHASFSTALFPGKINWDTLLEGSDWFHFSAISPAINEQAAAVCLDAVKAAKRLGLSISVDLNYRAKLWKYGKQPAQVMPELVSYADVIMGNIWSARDLLGIEVPKGAEAAITKEDFAACAKETSAVLFTQNPNCKVVASTFRFTPDGAGVHYYATLDTITDQFLSVSFEANSVVDKVGSGDCFMAGLIYGIHNGHSHQETINYAASAAFGKLQELGDSTRQTIEQIKSRY